MDISQIIKDAVFIEVQYDTENNMETAYFVVSPLLVTECCPEIVRTTLAVTYPHTDNPPEARDSSVQAIPVFLDDFSAMSSGCPVDLDLAYEDVELLLQKAKQKHAFDKEMENIL